MGHVALEAVILAPLLVIQIILFPFVANALASNWSNATRDITIKELASQMAATIQQMYLSLNRPEISAGNTTQTSPFPKDISGHPYDAMGSLEESFRPGFGKVLFLNVTLQDIGNTVLVQTPLGPNVLWNEESIFTSSSPNASIRVQKFVNGTLLFSF